MTDRFSLETTGGPFGIGSVMWLGANDEATEGNFVWMSSGNPVVFADWDFSEPSDNSGAENCAVFFQSTKKWYDVPCSTPVQMFICKG